MTGKMVVIFFSCNEHFFGDKKEIQTSKTWPKWTPGGLFVNVSQPCHFVCELRVLRVAEDRFFSFLFFRPVSWILRQSPACVLAAHLWCPSSPAAAGPYGSRPQPGCPIRDAFALGLADFGPHALCGDHLDLHILLRDTTSTHYICALYILYVCVHVCVCIHPSIHSGSGPRTSQSSGGGGSDTP